MMIWLFWAISLFALNSYANAQPMKCPNVADIQNVGLSERLVQDNDGKWYAGRTAQYYNTMDQWTFVIGNISAPNKEKAFTFANNALLTLSYKSGPMKGPSDKYICVYNNDFDYVSGAVTPPINMDMSYVFIKG
jgi:Domain of unknown function (DUF4949)